MNLDYENSLNFAYMTGQLQLFCSPLHPHPDNVLPSQSQLFFLLPGVKCFSVCNETEEGNVGGGGGGGG
jgi:hypothetical protein